MKVSFYLLLTVILASFCQAQEVPPPPRLALSFSASESFCFNSIILDCPNPDPKSSSPVIRHFKCEKNDGIWVEVFPAVKWREVDHAIVKFVPITEKELQSIMGPTLFKQLNVKVSISRYWNLSDNPAYDWPRFAGDNITVEMARKKGWKGLTHMNSPAKMNSR